MVPAAFMTILPLAHNAFVARMGLLHRCVRSRYAPHTPCSGGDRQCQGEPNGAMCLLRVPVAGPAPAVFMAMLLSSSSVWVADVLLCMDTVASDVSGCRPQ
jgi:hypothetical protein